MLVEVQAVRHVQRVAHHDAIDEDIKNPAQRIDVQQLVASVERVELLVGREADALDERVDCVALPARAYQVEVLVRASQRGLAADAHRIETAMPPVARSATPAAVAWLISFKASSRGSSSASRCCEGAFMAARVNRPKRLTLCHLRLTV